MTRVAVFIDYQNLYLGARETFDMTRDHSCTDRSTRAAMRNEFDVAVLASADTDLVPALETVLSLGKRCEVVAWQAKGGRNSRLATPGRNI